MDLREIGPIAHLQIQRSPLKVGQKPHRVYDTTPLLGVTRLQVTSHGAIAFLPDGQTLIDVHHAHQPHSRYGGSNSVSIGFTPNYRRLRERFGAHMIDGCAGENILIETDQPIELDDLQRGAAIRCAGGALLWLGDIIIAFPCIEFSRYSLQRPLAEPDSAEVKATLQFLSNGTRGFYTTPANDNRPLVVSVGDRVYLPE